MENFLKQTSTDIDNNCRANKQIFNEAFNQENPVIKNLLKWQDDGDEHIKKVEDHLIAQKVLIAEDMANILGAFGEMCQKLKQQ